MRFDRPVPEIRIAVTQLQCTLCGAETHASCNCGAVYRPKPAERAAAAITGNSSRSDRAIAAEIGVSPTTVAKARDQLSGDGQCEDFRTGKDGRTRKMPSYFADPEPVLRDELIEQGLDLVREMTPLERAEFIKRVGRLI
jgi:hypothetical protein